MQIRDKNVLELKDLETKVYIFIYLIVEALATPFLQYISLSM